MLACGQHTSEKAVHILRLPQIVLDSRGAWVHRAFRRAGEKTGGQFREVKPANERQARRFAQDPELISIKATQALLGDKTVRRLVKTGRIEAVKVGARLMPRLASVRSFARGE
jgi:hypothetical protein